MREIVNKSLIELQLDDILFQERSAGNNKRLLFDDELCNIYDFVSHYRFTDSKTAIKRNNVRKGAKHFFDEHLPLQNILIYKNSKFEEISPFDLFIDYQESMNSGVCPLYKCIDDGVERLLPSHIVLRDTINILSIPTYAHELVHTQLIKNEALIENYFNREVISIFIEKVLSYHLNERLSYEIYFYRLCALRYSLREYRKHFGEIKVGEFKQRCYIEGTLKAAHLFDIYVRSNSAIKLEILNDIEEVFKENKTVEDILNKYAITYENSKKLEYIKRH